MKREHTKSESYIDWLKSLGCIVYMPLHSNLVDQISGESLSLTGTGSMVYNSNEDMTLVSLGPNAGYNIPLNTIYYVASLDIQFTSKITNALTCLCKGKRYTSNRVARGFGIKNPSINMSWCLMPMYNGTSGMSSWPSSSFDYAQICDYTQNNVITYINGALSATFTINASYLPQNWNVQGDGLIFGLATHPSAANAKYYISDFYIFNQALDLTTIRKIQGYE